MPINSKQKGMKAEREVAAILRAAGIPDAVKTPEYAVDDVIGTVRGKRTRFEVKRRRKGFCGLYTILEATQADAVVHRDDRRPWLITLSLRSYLDLAAPKPMGGE